MYFDEKLAFGRVLVRVITPEPMLDLMDYMKENDHRFTNVGGEGRFGKVNLLFTVLKRDSLKSFIEKVKSLDEKAFYTIEGVKRASEDDMNLMEDRPSFRFKFFSKARI
jgi:uncharacterized protein YebE (UPF0316 family)